MSLLFQRFGKTMVSLLVLALFAAVPVTVSAVPTNGLHFDSNGRLHHNVAEWEKRIEEHAHRKNGQDQATKALKPKRDRRQLESGTFECCEESACDPNYCTVTTEASAQDCFDIGWSFAYNVDEATCEESNYPIACCFSSDEFGNGVCDVTFDCPTRSVSGDPFECYSFDRLPYYIDTAGDATCEVVDPEQFDPMAPFDCCDDADCFKESCFFYGVTLQECYEKGFPYGIRVIPYERRHLIPADPNMPTLGVCLRSGRGSMRNDPHITSWNGTMYDWQGECDVVLLEAPHFDDATSLQIHTRTKMRYDYSYIESAAIRLGNDTLQVSSFGEYFFNGVESAKLPATLGGFQVTRQEVDAKRTIFQILLNDQERILVETFKDIVSVDIEHADYTRFHDSIGMLGEYGGQGRLLARDGITAVMDPYELAQEWQVRPEQDGLLFQTLREPQYPQECKAPSLDSSTATTRRLGQTMVSQEEAQKACEHLNGAQKDACVLDVIGTGDVDIALTY